MRDTGVVQPVVGRTSQLSLRISHTVSYHYSALLIKNELCAPTGTAYATTNIAHPDEYIRTGHADVLEKVSGKKLSGVKSSRCTQCVFN